MGVAGMIALLGAKSLQVEASMWSQTKRRPTPHRVGRLVVCGGGSGGFGYCHISPGLPPVYGFLFRRELDGGVGIAQAAKAYTEPVGNLFRYALGPLILIVCE